MAANDPFASALDLAAAIRRREVSPVEALDRCLAEVDRLNDTVNAVVWRDDAEAREQAQEAERALGRTDPDLLPPFHGVPLPIKDLTPVEGWPVTYGSHAGPDGPERAGRDRRGQVPRRRVRPRGRTNTPEFGPITAGREPPLRAHAQPLGPGPHAGRVQRRRRRRGGRGHVPDGPRQRRRRLDPHPRLVLRPRRPQAQPRPRPPLGAVVAGRRRRGRRTGTVADSAAALDAISGPDPLAWYNAPVPARPFAAEVDAEQAPLRIGLVETAPLGLPLDSACADAASVTAGLLTELGHHVEPVIFDTLHEDLVEMAVPVIWARPRRLRGRRLAQRGASQRGRREQASGAGLIDLARAIQGLQFRSREIVAHWSRDFDVLLTPTLSIEPPAVGAVLEAVHANPTEPAVPVLQMVAFTILFNITGQPAITVPLHRTGEGLPIGAQLVGGPWDEATLIRLASALEQAAPWAARRPDVERLAAA